MKKLSYFLLLFILIFIYSCEKNDVTTNQDSLIPENKQWAFMGEVTSTTCGICGGSGYNNFNLMKKTYSGKIVALAFHCNFPSDSMQSPLLYSYESSRPTGGGIPSFHIGDTKTSYNSLAPYIDTILKKSPEAQVKFKTSVSGDSMKITSKIKFFKNVTGEYYISFFLCEHGIDGGATAVTGYKQSGGVSDYKHNNVVRNGNMPSMAYGTPITTSTSISANTVFDYSCKIGINSRWKRENLFVTSVIWKKNPDNGAECQYLFVNGWDTQVYK